MIVSLGPLHLLTIFLKSLLFGPKNNRVFRYCAFFPVAMPWRQTLFSFRFIICLLTAVFCNERWLHILDTPPSSRASDFGRFPTSFAAARRAQVSFGKILPSSIWVSWAHQKKKKTVVLAHRQNTEIRDEWQQQQCAKSCASERRKIEREKTRFQQQFVTRDENRCHLNANNICFFFDWLTS